MLVIYCLIYVLVGGFLMVLVEKLGGTFDDRFMFWIFWLWPFYLVHCLLSVICSVVIVLWRWVFSL